VLDDLATPLELRARAMARQGRIELLVPVMSRQVVRPSIQLRLPVVKAKLRQAEIALPGAGMYRQSRYPQAQPSRPVVNLEHRALVVDPFVSAGAQIRSRMFLIQL